VPPQLPSARATPPTATSIRERSEDDLWANHPALQATPVIQPCTTRGVSNFDDQCVIRLGEAMTAAGLDLSSYPLAGDLVLEDEMSRR
jgi:hypothetical protein